ncbi:DUF58 domain-containing protein [Halorientalis brevis]|uniref:DUF58 domain-containing protein n=1 Tax=Halorientalis brevis TaxID=1126241 RepID=A0ABD6C7C1_9EURY|nr:DUF58 domain-containing protein [Halorientalis brevis]
MNAAVETSATGVQRTDRWRGIGAATLLASAFALMTRTPALLFVSAAGVSLLAYVRVVSPPPISLSVSRTVSEDDPEQGDDVTVTLTIQNVGERTVPELRFVDGVPPTLRVVDGAASVGTALRPGAATTLRYEVEAGHGRQEFRPATAIGRDVTGVVERRVQVAVTGDDAVGRHPSVSEGNVPSLPTTAARYAGQHTTDRAGPGLTFRSVREYNRGDSVSRIDWRRRARTGELATIEFHEERSLEVVLVVDTRSAAALAPTPNEKTAIERAQAAAAPLFGGLLGEGHRVGIATLGPERAWLAPGRGAAHEHRARELLSARPPALSADGGEPEPGAWLRDRLPPHATVVLLMPACDDGVVDLIRRLDATGTTVTVLSPDPTATESAGQQLARLERRVRLRRLRAAGIPVVDWDPSEDLRRTLATARWSV